MKKNLVIFTGAGISAESGLGTFRASDGLWEKHRIEDVATPEAWDKNQTMVQDFYNQRRKNCMDAQPNSAHIRLKELESHFEIKIITQNIDNLHERAGSTDVTHLHGDITKAKCSICKDEQYYEIPSGILTDKDTCPKGHQLRPHVVWFGEEVPMMDRAIEICQSADIFIIIGTSLNVYPASSLKSFVAQAHPKFIIDPDPNMAISVKFTHIQSSATEGMDIVTKELTKKKP
jgi:NAD-dependent deacetylase